jgi:formylglycine-generating enzyme required for sulfatase activity
MARIPAGEFLMGCDPSSSVAPCLDGESPPHLIYLEEYYIDLTEVSIIQYKQCMMEETCRPPDFGESDIHIFRYLNPEYSDHPIVSIDWYDARQYCTWRGKRLPNEAEWEKAARGAEDERFFPWGNDTPNCILTNFNGLNESCPGETSPIGEYIAGASPYGALNMAGNVREWVADWYDANKYFSPDSEIPREYDPGGEKVLRGGSYNSDWIGVRVNYRGHNPPTHFSFDTGFRCAIDP